MPKALFMNVPGHGHVNPSLPLVAELVRRGHGITYLVTGEYRARVEATGARFQAYAAVRDDYFDARGLSGSVPGRVARELMATAAEILPELLDTARAIQPDYVMYDGMCPWGYMVARILRVPAVASLSLMVMPPKIFLNLQTARAFLKIMLRDFTLFNNAAARSRALGKAFGFPPLGQSLLLNAFGDISFSYTSSYFQPFAATLDKSIHFVGPAAGDSPAIHSFSFDRVQGRRLIYLSLGTMNNDDAKFFRTCIDAFSGSDDFVVISTGNRINPEALGPVPDNISIHSWVPQSEVLRQTALFITHAGMNSVHDGLYRGIPLLLIPQQDEQSITARRVVELGAGLLLERAQVSVESIRRTAARLLAEPRFRVEAKRIGDTFRAAGGAGLAADKIEAMLRNP